MPLEMIDQKIEVPTMQGAGLKRAIIMANETTHAD